MDRRTFVSHAGVAAGALWLPAPTARRRDRGEDRKALADAALNAARQGGAGYADVRISRYLTQSLGGRERSIQTVSAAESYGAGVRVLVGGAWGFAATADVTTARGMPASRTDSTYRTEESYTSTPSVRMMSTTKSFLRFARPMTVFADGGSSGEPSGSAMPR